VVVTRRERAASVSDLDGVRASGGRGNLRVSTAGSSVIVSEGIESSSIKTLEELNSQCEASEASEGRRRRISMPMDPSRSFGGGVGGSMAGMSRGAMMGRLSGMGIGATLGNNRSSLPSSLLAFKN